MRWWLSRRRTDANASRQAFRCGGSSYLPHVGHGEGMREGGWWRTTPVEITSARRLAAVKSGGAGGSDSGQSVLFPARISSPFIAPSLCQSYLDGLGRSTQVFVRGLLLAVAL